MHFVHGIGRPATVPGGGSTLLIVLLLAALATCSVWAADWPRWRGPEGNGVSAETGWNPKALSGNPKILWRKNIGYGHSAIASQGEWVFTMGAMKRQSGGQTTWEETVFCLDAKTGREVWRYVYPARYRDFPGPGATPAATKDRLYTMGRAGEVFCFDIRTGRVMWRRQLVAETLARVPNWGFHASPVIVGDKVLLNAGRSGIALDAKTGRTVWTSEPEAGGLSSPVLMNAGGRQLAAIASRGTIYWVDVTTGKVAWTHRWQSDSDPLMYGNNIYLPGSGRNVPSVMLELTADGPKERWRNDKISASFLTGVILGDHAYGYYRAGRAVPMTCAELQGGEPKWQQDLGEWGSLTAVDDKLLILDGDGDLVIAAATPKAYTVLSQVRLFNITPPTNQNDTELNTCWTAPIMANGRIYARTTHGELACVDVSR